MKRVVQRPRCVWCGRIVSTTDVTTCVAHRDLEQALRLYYNGGRIGHAA